jgi:hypothetical protein
MERLRRPFQELGGRDHAVVDGSLESVHDALLFWIDGGEKTLGDEVVLQRIAGRRAARRSLRRPGLG